MQLLLTMLQLCILSFHTEADFSPCLSWPSVLWRWVCKVAKRQGDSQATISQLTATSLAESSLIGIMFTLVTASTCFATIGTMIR